MSKLIGAKLGNTAYLSVTDDGKLQYSLTGADGDFVEFETSGGGGDIDTSNLTATADDLLATKTAIGLDGAEITGTIQTVTLQQSGNTVSIAKGYVAENASITVPGEGGGTDISDATATADMVLADAIFYGADGRDTGTIQTVTATLTDNVVAVPKGYIAEAQTLTVAEATATLTDNIVTVPKGYHQAQTLTVAVAEAPAVSDNVVTVHKGYVTADTDVTIATATASKSGNVVTIPKGYHQAQTLTVGTAKEAETIVPGDADIIIPADTYLAGDLTIQAVGGGTGDSNIAYGVLDADGNFQALDLSGENPVDSGTAESISELVMYQTGHDEPAYPSGGGGMDFYKCSAVADGVWTGKKATQTANGVWSIAAEETPNLSIVGYTPKVGTIYSADTTLEIRRAFDGSVIPITQNGLVFYAPLQADYVDMISGNSATVTAGSFTEINAKEGLRLTNEYIKWPEYSNLPAREDDISFGFLIIPMDGSTRQTLIGVGNEDSCLPIQYEDESILDFGGDLPSDDKWHTVLLTRAGSNSAKIYIDGISAGESGAAFYPESSCVCVGALMSYGYAQTSNAFFSEVFVYNRELTAAEVLEIHNTLMEGVTQ